MISEERSRYKSWSNLRKQMNELLCDSLKDRISYFCTSYHEVHNAYGRAAISCDKKEIAAFSGQTCMRRNSRYHGSSAKERAFPMKRLKEKSGCRSAYCATRILYIP